MLRYASSCGAVPLGKIFSASHFLEAADSALELEACVTGRIKAFGLSIGGEERAVEHSGPRYVAIYEIDDPKVLISAEWAAAVEQGRWPGDVRPFTRNRAHALYKLR